MNREEFEHKIFKMMNYAAKAKAIGDEIADRISPYGDGELYSLLNSIQNCEVTEIGTALEVFDRVISQ